MKRILPKIALCLLVLISFVCHQSAKGQTTELLAGNVLNGAVTGTILGTGIMGLQNSDDFSPLRVGLGAGILGGAGFALYDVTTLPKGQQFFISGVFNDGNNSSILILLDTLYGVGGGAVLGTAVMLIRDKPLLEGLQYGGSAGAWAGFGFGLIDAFVLAERNNDFIAQKISGRSGLIEYDMGMLDVALLQPELYQQTIFGNNSLSMNINPGVKLFSFGASF